MPTATDQMLRLLPPPSLRAALGCLSAPGELWCAQEGGQTNRLWRTPSNLVVKLYITDPPNPLFANDAAAEAACLQVLAPAALAPRLRAQGHLPEGAWIAYDHVPGHPWRKDPAMVARLLRGLHALPVPEALPKAPANVALREITESILAKVASNHARDLHALAPPSVALPMGRQAFLHGDPVPGNLIVSGQKATLIDWQCPAVGDPVHDLALFMSPGMQQVYRGAPLSEAEEAITIAAYDCPETAYRLALLRPHYHWLMAAYCTWKAAHASAESAKAYMQAAALECARLS